MQKLIAVVTGGTRGIGLGIVGSLLKRGACVAVTYRTDEKAAQKARAHLDAFIKAPQQIMLLKGDGGDPAVVSQHARQISETLGPVNVLVNNAGIMPQKSFDTITFKEWDETIRVNLSSAFYWCSQVIPGMKAAGFGRIVNRFQGGHAGPDPIRRPGAGALRDHGQRHRSGLYRRRRHFCGLVPGSKGGLEGKGRRLPHRTG